MKVLATLAALATTALSYDYCQRGWFQLLSSADADNADTYADSAFTDFEVCSGYKVKSSGDEVGVWYECSDLSGDDEIDYGQSVNSLNGANGTYAWVDMVTFDRFKCRDKSDASETDNVRVGAVGPLDSQAWIDLMADYVQAEGLDASTFMLYNEDDTYCDQFLTAQCTIEINAIMTNDMTMPPYAGETSCDDPETYRTKKQYSTRACVAGMVYNCTSGDAYEVTAYENVDCSGQSQTYQYASGCQYRYTYYNGYMRNNTGDRVEERVLQCHACPALATMAAVALALFAALFN